MTERARVRKSGNRPTYVGLKLALAASSLVASLVGARLLARAPDGNPPQDAPAEASRQVIIVRRYVEVGTGAPVSSGSSSVTLPPIPTAVPYVAPPPVTQTRSS